MVKRHRPVLVRSRQAGLTLVELMVTIVLASIVASSTFMFFVGQRRVYDTQMKILNTQQNLWASMETVSRFMRLGGMGMIGCVNALDPPPTGATPPATGLRVYRSGPPEEVIRLAPLWIKNGEDGAPDEVTVAFGTGTFGNFSDAALGATVSMPTGAITTPPGLTSVFRANEFAVLIDTTVNPVGPPAGDRGCTLFQITGITSGTNTLLHETSSSFNPGSDVDKLVPWSYTGGASPKAGIRNFGTLNWVRFAIDSTGAPGKAPRLMMSRLDGNNGPVGPQVLAEGIEDMQIAYACDIAAPGPDGIFSEGTDEGTKKIDEWTYNVAGDVPLVGCNRPHALRVTIIARSTDPDTTLSGLGTNAKPAVEDGVAGPVDTFRHRVISTSVYPRNR
jgi:prepilin-type N-terminal cleavage/methylation domain-containing protein